MNEDEEYWQEPKPIMTDKQFVVAVIISAMLFLLFTILHFYNEQNKNNNKTKSEPTNECVHY